MPALTIDDQALDRVDRFFDEFHRERHVPGIAYGLVLDRALIHSGGTGTTSFSDERTPDKTTLSRICSMTKSFVAVAMLMLRAEGALGFDDLISEHVPELRGLRLPTSDSPPITLRHLLTMSGGLPGDDAWADRHMDRSREWVTECFRGGFTFARAPGIAFEYSNLGWVALGRAVSNVTGISTQDFVRDRILTPLRMTDSRWDVPSGANVAIGHRWRDGSFEEVGPPIEDGDFAPMGGLWSTIEDLSRWVSFFSEAFPARDGNDNGILSRAARREMQQVHRMWPIDGDDDSHRALGRGYGYGLVVEQDRRLGYCVGHPGGLPGFGSFMRWLPDRGVGVIALGNATYAPMDRATLGALDVLDEEGALPPANVVALSPHLRRAGDQLLSLLNEWSDELASASFALNVSLDEELHRRRKRMQALRSEYGPFERSALDPISATSATFVFRGSKGDVKGSLLLSPESPPKIQTYEVEGVAGD